MIKGSTFRIRVYRSTIAAAAAAAALMGSNVGLAASAFAVGGPGSAPPAFLSSTSGDGTGTVTWSPATAPNGFAIANYSIVYTARGAAPVVTDSENAQQSSDTATGLVDGIVYDVALTANYTDNSSDAATNAQTVSPMVAAAAPAAPTAVTAVPVTTTAGAAAADVTWTAGADNGAAITTYTVTAHDTTASTTSTTTTATTAKRVGSLVDGHSYTFTVTATNSAGTSPDSAASTAVTASTVPGAPTGVSATVGTTPATARQATVSWTAPGDTGGLALTGYTVTYTDTTASTSGTVSGGGAAATTKTVTGLTAGDNYTFAVVAANADGNGAASTPPATATPVDVPGQPTGLSAVAGPAGAQATVTWTAPAANGSPITSYNVRHIDTSDNTGAHDATVSVGAGARSSTATALVPGDVYSFTVTAVNAIGTGPVSHASGTATPFTTPSAPTGVAATGGNGSAHVTWNAPAAANGSPVTGYRVVYTDAATPADNGSFVSTGTATSATVPGLVGGETYVFTVRATNAAGDGTASAPSSALAVTSSPGAPTGVTAVAGPGDAQATVSWTAPANNGGVAVTGYTVSLDDGVDPATIVAAGAADRSALVLGLTPGTAYTATVTATNSVGTGGAGTAAATVTPFTVPGAPTGVTGTRGDTTVAVSWTAPASTGGSPVTGYTVSYTDTTTSAGSGTTGLLGTGTTTTVTGLTDGDAYTFTVTAANAAGTGPASTASAPVTPATGPGIPSAVVATPHDTTVGLSWTAPTTNGGAPITGYLITATDTSTTPSPVTTSTTTGNGTTGTVTGLTNGDSYTFTVAAINSVTTGAPSDPSTAVTPFTVADAPTGVTAVRGYRSVTLTWTAPTNTGGSPITTYKLFIYDATNSSHSAVNGYTPTGQGTATTATIASLFPGESYTFKVETVNAAGTSVLSAASNAVTPYTLPGAPTTVTGVRGDSSAALTWVAPAADGGSPITGYRIDSVDTFSGAMASTTAAAGATTATVTGLTNGDPYTFTVTAINAAGPGPASAITSSSTVTPATLPSQVTGVTAVPGGSGATVTWTAGSNGGDPLTGSTVAWTDTSDQSGNHDGSQVATGAATTATVTGLVPGDAYFFTVTPTNTVGSGPVSHESNTVTPFDVPGAPTAVGATAGSSSVAVTWTAPASDGGSPVTGYVVSATAGSTTVATNAGAGATTATVSGLTAGTAYTVRVVAVNAAGPSAAGTAPGTTTPYTSPGAPTAVAATATQGGAHVTWAAPAADGGSPVTGYQVSWVDTTNAAGSGTSAVLGAGVFADDLALTVGHSYTVTVAAINTAGTGTPSAPTAAVVPFTIPGAPTAVTGTSTDGAVDLAWTAPASDGFSPINGYEIAWTDTSDLSGNGNNTLSPTGVATTAHITGLVNGDSYTFTVTATNSAGPGPVSATSAPVTPAALASAPRTVTAVAGSSRATVSWTAPANTGGAPVVGYTVSWVDSTDLSGDSDSATGLLGTGTTAVVPGLTPGDSYTFSVTATTAAGVGAASAATSAVTPYTVAGAPTGVGASRGNGSAVVSWTAPVANGYSAITGYTITATDTASGVSTDTAAAAGTSGTVSNLTNGDPYTFTVAAVNAAGTGAPSTASAAITPATIPGAPTAVVATGSSSSVALAWTAPVSDGGAPITSYLVTWVDTDDQSSGHDGSRTFTGAGTTAVVTGLTPGQAYFFTVTPTNGVGVGPASHESNTATPYTVPAAPTAVTATAGHNQLTVAWTAPGSNGFSPLTGYTVTVTGGIAPVTRTVLAGVTTATVTGLLAGTDYTVTVVATNVAGDSLAGTAPGTTAPYTVPDAPTGVVGVRGDGTAVLTWAAPAGTGGSPLTGYTVTTTDVLSGLSTTSTAAADTLTATVAGLTNGRAYTFTVTALNLAGAGLPSAASAAVTPATVPGVATAVTATAGSSSASVTWTAPAVTGGSAVTGYTIVGTDTTDSDGSVQVPSDGPGTTASLDGLVPGDDYTFTVVAVNDVGPGAASVASSSVTPYTTPAAPTGVTAVTGADGAPVVSWTAPADGFSPITGYLVSYNGGDDSGVVTAAPGVTSLELSGLTVGNTYTFTVTAENLAGAGDPSDATDAVTVFSVPGIPTGVAAAATSGGASATWTAPAATGGSDLTGYTVTYTDTTSVGPSHDVIDTVDADSTSDSADLVPGDHYTVAVAATNQYGTGLASAPTAAVVPFTTPGVPTGVTATAGDTTATVRWTAPAANGFSALTGYDVVAVDTSTSTTMPAVHVAFPAHSVLVPGLTDGDTYTFTVVAINTAGSSDASAASAAVTPNVALVVTASTLPDRVAVKTSTITIPFTLTLNRVGAVTVKLKRGTTIVSTVLVPAGTTSVSGSFIVDTSSAAQLGGFAWAVSDTTAVTVLSVSPVVLAQPSMLGLGATRSGSTITLHGAAKYTGPPASTVSAWAGRPVAVQRFTSSGWVTIRTVTTDAAGHIALTLVIPFRVGLRLVDADTGVVFGATSNSVVL